MRNKKATSLIILLVFLIIYGIKLIADAKPQLKMVDTNISGLIRKGYDLVDDSHAFSKLCTLLNDSLLLQKNSVKTAVFTDINLSDSIISWCLLCYNDESEVLKVSDQYFFNIDLYKGGYMKVQDSSIQLSDIRNIVIDDTFYPDSISRQRIFTKRNINLKKDVKLSDAGIYMRVHIKDSNGFSVSDWQAFYNCLHEFIKLFDEERNKISQKTWNKDYDSLSFQEKEKIVDFASYRINIEFR